MTAAERHRRAVALFNEACELAPAERDAFLEQQCGQDVELLHEVKSLLAYDQADSALVASIDGGKAADLLAADLAADEEISETSASPLTPRRIGRYRILRLLGQGGMGAVYEAEQESPRRHVALKMIRPGMATPEVVRRFEREVRALGQLQHAGIAQVYEAGVAEFDSTDVAGQPYFAMEFVDGVPPGEFAARRRLCARSRLELVARVADAVHYAHEHGIVHRDLKPANVLVAIGNGATTSKMPLTALECGVSEVCRELRCAGQPKILDFGVARLTDADVKMVTMHTEAGQLVGTLSYMSPEQVAGSARDLDRRSDVYSLGMILYELLAGKLPYDLRRLSIPEAARIIREDDPSRLGSIDSQYRGDIETIVAKALSKERERRYPTAAALAADIRRFLRDEPIVARPTSTFYQARKFARRNKGLVGGVFAAVICLVAGLISTLQFAFREANAHRAADRALYHASLAAAGAALREDDVAAAEQHLLAAPEELRGWEWEHLFSQLDQSSGSAEFNQHLTRLNSPVSRGDAIVWFDESNRRVHMAYWCGPDDQLEVAGWDATTLEHQGGWSLNGAHLFAPLIGGATLMVPTEGRIELRDATTGELRDVVDASLPKPKRQLIRSAVPPGIVAAGARRFLSALPWSGGFAVFSADGRRVCLADNTTVSVVDLVSDTAPIVLEPHVEGIGDAVFTPDGNRLITAGNNRRLACFDLERGGRRVWQRLDAHQDAILAADVSPDGSTLATGGQDRVLRLWNARTGEPRGTLVGHREPILAVTFNDDGAQLVSCSSGSVHTWQSAAAADPNVLRGHTAFVQSLAISPDGALLASGGQELRIWDARTATCVFELAADGQGVYSRLSFSGDGRRLLAVRDAPVSGAHTHAGFVLDVCTGQVVHALNDVGTTWDSAAFSSAGWLVVSKGAELYLLDASTYTQIASVNGAPRQFGFDLAGTRLAVAGADVQEIFDLPSLTVLRTWNRAATHVRRLIQNGETLALALPDGGIALLDVATGRERSVLRRHTGKVTCFAELPERDVLISGADDRTVRVWDLKSMEELCVLRGHDDKVWDLVVTPDGKTIYSASGDYTIRRWDTRPLRDLLAARAKYEHIATSVAPRVNALFVECGDPVAVTDRIENDDGLTERERQIALQLVLRESTTRAQ